MRPHILVVGHYPVDPADRAPAVRIRALTAALGAHAAVTLIADRRGPRAERLRAWMRKRPGPQVDAVYVESASSTATPADLVFLSWVRARRIPLGIFVRDYYQRFPDLYPPRGARERLMAAAYAATLSAYRRMADVLFFPTGGLAALVGGRRIHLLPPGGAVLEPPAEGHRLARVVYVGAAHPRDGVPLLLEAWPHVRRRHPGAELVVVVRPEEWPGWALPEGAVRVAAHGEALAPWLWSASLAVIPRLDTAYHRIALPVKLFDYWAHGLGVLVTGRCEAAEWVAREGAGAPVWPPTPSAWAEALTWALDDPARLQGWSWAALSAIRARHSWDKRALELLQVLLGRQ
ncbi:MAG: glycosyltransferase [Firmicutes bacterium]|nr:glycosyltransferase family 4 protein [Alicyclobacillaceae bacterium]MCL6498153.1 glycosyltransferase [Bacillota bacterium]